MKIDSQASRNAIRSRYGSVRQFARECMGEHGMPNIAAAYDLVGKVLMEQRGTSKRPSVSRSIRERLAREGLLVMEQQAAVGD